jgi:hypothetical protein
MNVGVTGHQKLDQSKAWRWVEEQMRTELAKLPQPLICISSLAIGADQLLATIVLELGGALRAVIPYAGIERSFSTKDVTKFKELYAKATVETLHTTGSDQDAYLAAGERVTDLSEVLFAVWDGRPAKGRGGTGDVVSYALDKGKAVVVFDPIRRVVRQP